MICKKICCSSTFIGSILTPLQSSISGYDFSVFTSIQKGGNILWVNDNGMKKTVTLHVCASNCVEL